jgi:hypothetical protein
MPAQYQQPNAVVEGSPGVFYVAGGNAILSVTTQGTMTILASFPSPPYTIESDPGAVAANGLLYSSVDQVQTNGGSASVFSVESTTGSERIYAKQSVGPVLSGNLPDGKLFGLVYTTLRLGPGFWAPPTSRVT